jgi:hypothetical protein
MAATASNASATSSSIAGIGAMLPPQTGTSLEDSSFAVSVTGQISHGNFGPSGNYLPLIILIYIFNARHF